MKLSELVRQVPIQNIIGATDIEIKGLSQDSRRIATGDLFFCIKGSKIDGHLFLGQAAEKGAVAAIVQDPPPDNFNLTIIQVPDVLQVIKEVAGAFYGYPDRKLQLIGVVGTNGKTTTTYLVKSILEAAGYKVGLIGTIAHFIGEQNLESHNTTPGILELQQIFGKMAAAGMEYAVMEVSSHSIAQGRIAGLSFRLGIFTNITQDHLDYHGTFAEYLRVKSSFFADLPQASLAIINNDDNHAETIIDKTAAKVITYGVEHPCDVQAQNIDITVQGAKYTAATATGSVPISLKITSLCNVYNSLGALAAGMALGIDMAVIKRGLETVAGIPGRFQPVPEARDFSVFIDYAHTPDGLENVLQTGRKLVSGRLIVVFGCGGDRDRTKRPIMGAIAARLADLAIITSDNPRSEDPLQIVKEIEQGFIRANPAAKYILEVDRATAIKRGISIAEPGDHIWIVGKGHEDYQILADQTIHFDDREVAREALEERFSGQLQA